jgi:hypothetical protein
MMQSVVSGRAYCALLPSFASLPAHGPQQQQVYSSPNGLKAKFLANGRRQWSTRKILSIIFFFFYFFALFPGLSNDGKILTAEGPLTIFGCQNI